MVAALGGARIPFHRDRGIGRHATPEIVEDAQIVCGLGNTLEGDGELPSDEDIDKVMTMAEKVMRRFFGFVKELKRDLNSDQL